jgi:hypothetical protein
MSVSLRSLALIAFIGTAVSLFAESEDPTPPSTGPISRIADSERLATGVHELTGQERANLDNLINYEISSARAGNVNGFAGSFSSRRSTAELDATGIERLSVEQRERLDDHIAGFIADTPTVPYLTRAERGRYRGSATRTLEEGDMISRPPLLNVNGSVSVTVGGSSAGTFYGGSMTTIISDPKGRFSAAITVGSMRGALPYYDRYDRYERSSPRLRP